MKTIVTFIMAVFLVASVGATEGEKIYKQYCMACHAASNIMVSSPKFGDATEWEKRKEERGGLSKLVQSAMKGRNAMPKKGRCINCKPDQLESAIVYMMKGGN